MAIAWDGPVRLYPTMDTSDGSGSITAMQADELETPAMVAR